MDKWIGNGKPWKPLKLTGDTQTPEGITKLGKEMQQAFDAIWGAKEQQEELIGKGLGILPKEPQWRPADPVDWPRQFMGRWVPFESKVNAPNTLDAPQFEGNWPGYFGDMF
jgi:hypothetical protein